MAYASQAEFYAPFAAGAKIGKNVSDTPRSCFGVPPADATNPGTGPTGTPAVASAPSAPAPIESTPQPQAPAGGVLSQIPGVGGGAGAAAAKF